MKDIVGVFREIWKVADELAEEETVQFEKLPYKKRVMVETSDEGSDKCGFIELNRTEYKDDKRQKHILEMLSMLDGGGDEGVDN